jgi:hypothetical protein
MKAARFTPRGLFLWSRTVAGVRLTLQQGVARMASLIPVALDAARPTLHRTRA